MGFDRTAKLISLSALIISAMLFAACTAEDTAWDKISELTESSRGGAEPVLEVIGLLPSEDFAAPDEFYYTSDQNGFDKAYEYYGQADAAVKWISAEYAFRSGDEGFVNEMLDGFHTRLNAENAKDREKYAYYYTWLVEEDVGHAARGMGFHPGVHMDKYEIPPDTDTGIRFISAFDTKVSAASLIELIIMRERWDVLTQEVLSMLGLGRESEFTSAFDVLNELAAFTTVAPSAPNMQAFLEAAAQNAPERVKLYAYLLNLGGDALAEANSYKSPERAGIGSDISRGYLSYVRAAPDLTDIKLDAPLNLPLGAFAKNKRGEVSEGPVTDNGYALSINNVGEDDTASPGFEAFVLSARDDLTPVVLERARYLLCFDYEYIPTDLYYESLNLLGQPTGAVTQARILSGVLSVYDRKAGKLLGEMDIRFDDFPEKSDADNREPAFPAFECKNENNHYYTYTKTCLEWLSGLIRAD